jgi:hypothetical protein
MEATVSLRNALHLRCQTLSISWFDFTIVGLLLIGGMLFLHDVRHWSVGYIGDAQYGDARFWWDGAIHVAQGIFQDNPGKSFRPGYFILTGLTLPVFGTQFSHYYPYFLLTFLITTALFYFALRPVVGRFIAACVSSMIIINPYTAEWLATSTTDGMGLLLHLAALSCLLLGLNNGLKRGWLIAFSIFFALATLTRPIMTPFMGVVVIALLIFPPVPVKKRFGMAAWVLLAFCTPIILWMGAQKLMIDQWSLSTNDAGAFYAASDPMIQVWTPSMYAPIQSLAKEHFHVFAPNTGQINNTFWTETIKNYTNHPYYHIQRLAPHLLEVANFSPRMSQHERESWRAVCLVAMALGIALWLVSQGLWRRALMLGALALGLSFSRAHLGPLTLPAFLTMAGAVSSLLMKHGQTNRLPLFLLSCYWLMGAAMLYCVGGTWGPPLNHTFGMNALGYRLGNQFFFVNDLLIGCLFFFIATYAPTFPPRLTGSAVTQRFSQHRWLSTWLSHPSALAGGIIIGCLALFLAGLTAVYLMGTGIVLKRSYTHLTQTQKPYPKLTDIIKLYVERTGRSPVEIQSLHGGLGNHDSIHDFIFTGAASSFIWNFPGQNRAQVLVHAQKKVSPFTMGPAFVILEVPQHIADKGWIDVQGAFVVHQSVDKHNISNLPYYISAPSVQAFFPLSLDGQRFDTANAIWFPSVMSAAQLETSHQLHSKNAKMTWSDTSGESPFQRRFLLTPKTKDNTAHLILETANLQKPARLSFFYREESATGTSSSVNNSYDAAISVINDGLKKHTMVSAHEPYPNPKKTNKLNKVDILIPAHTRAIEISFKHLPPHSGIWVHEFNLSVANLQHTPPYGAHY